MPPPRFTYRLLFLCLLQHQSIPTGWDTETTKTKPNFAVSTFILKQTHVPIVTILLGVPYSFTLFIIGRVPRIMLSQLRVNHHFEFLETRKGF